MSKKKGTPTLVAIFNDPCGDGVRYMLGCVVFDVTGDDIDDHVRDLYSAWQDENPEPDSDGEFVDWLIEKGWAKEAPLPVTYVDVD